MGPPIWNRRWSAATLKTALTGGEASVLRDLPADETDGRALAAADMLEALGWTQKPPTGAGFGDVQPRYVFQSRLAGAPRTSCCMGSTSCGGATSRRPTQAGVSVSRGALELPAFHADLRRDR